MYTAFRIKVPHSHSVIFSPLLFFTPFFSPVSSSSLFPSLILSSPSDDYNSGDSHYESDRYLKVSAHISLSSPFSLCLYLSLSVPLTLRLSFFLFSKFQSAGDRIYRYSTSERKRSQNIKRNINQPIYISTFFSSFTATLFCAGWL